MVADPTGRGLTVKRGAEYGVKQHNAVTLMPSFAIKAQNNATLPPSVSFSTREDECSIDGTIDGAQAWITFQKHPFEDKGPLEKQS